jgi:hypothetical protein
MRVSSAGMASADPAVERLVEIGRRTGRLTFDELRQNLPIADMTAAEIVQAVTYLEQAGILIDVDAELLGEPGDASAETPLGPLPALPPERPAEATPRAAASAKASRELLLARTQPSATRSSAPHRVAASSPLRVAIAATLTVLTLLGLIGLATLPF